MYIILEECFTLLASDNILLVLASGSDPTYRAGCVKKSHTKAFRRKKRSFDGSTVAHSSSV